jgi:hypothetical protein
VPPAVYEGRRAYPVLKFCFEHVLVPPKRCNLSEGSRCSRGDGACVSSLDSFHRNISRSSGVVHAPEASIPFDDMLNFEIKVESETETFRIFLVFWRPVAE